LTLSPQKIKRSITYVESITIIKVFLRALRASVVSIVF
jgi:hypothetical protein